MNTFSKTVNNRTNSSKPDIRKLIEEFNVYKHPIYNNRIVDFSGYNDTKVITDYVKVWHFSDFPETKLFEEKSISNRTLKQCKELEQKTKRRYNYYKVPVSRWIEAKKEIYQNLNIYLNKKEKSKLKDILDDLFPCDEAFEIVNDKNSIYDIKYKGTTIIEIKENQDDKITLFVLSNFFDQTNLKNNYNAKATDIYKYIIIKEEEIEKVCDELMYIIRK